jgi:hypothetical protein
MLSQLREGSERWECRDRAFRAILEIAFVSFVTFGKSCFEDPGAFLSAQGVLRARAKEKG